MDSPSCDTYRLSSLLRSFGEPSPRTDIMFMIVLSWEEVSPSYRLFMYYFPSIYFLSLISESCYHFNLPLTITTGGRRIQRNKNLREPIDKQKLGKFQLHVTQFGIGKIKEIELCAKNTKGKNRVHKPKKKNRRRHIEKEVKTLRKNQFHFHCK